MSRENIIGQGFTKSGGYVVTFALRNGETRSYTYSPDAGVAIAGGADPADFAGEEGGSDDNDQISSGSIGETAGEAGTAGEIAEDIGGALL